MQNINSTLITHHGKSKSFNFLQLDTRLNTKKIQQTKREQRQKNVLSIYQKKLPNIQLIKECNKALQSYKDHYNINRRFSLFYEEKKQNSQKRQIKNYNKKLTNKLPSLENLKSSFIKIDQNLQNGKINSSPQTQRMVKPLKNSDGFIQKTIVRLTQKKQVTDKIFPQSSMQRKKKLKSLFRQNILLIVHKIKLMKLSFSQLLDNKIFDKSKPYKFGDKIFHAIKQGNESKTFRIMIQNRLSIFSFDTTGKTTLIWACIRGHAQIAELLLSNGVQPHLQDINGRSALYYAIKYDHFQCAKLLFIYAYRLQEELEQLSMSSQMRKTIRIGFESHKFLKKIDNIEKKKEHFVYEYRYYFKN